VAYPKEIGAPLRHWNRLPSGKKQDHFKNNKGIGGKRWGAWMNAVIKKAGVTAE